MAITPWQLALREAQAPVTQVLKSLGFRKAGNYYNRKGKDDLVEVVGFQSGQYTSILHGSFTVNLGVYIPCIAALENNAVTGKYVTDAHCEVRARLSEVAKFKKDQWWPLDDSAPKSGAAIAQALSSYAIPFFEKYNSNEKIIERFNEDGSLPFHNPARSALAVAILQWSCGDLDSARRSFDKASTVKSHNIRFTDYVNEVRLRCGL